MNTPQILSSRTVAIQERGRPRPQRLKRWTRWFLEMNGPVTPARRGRAPGLLRTRTSALLSGFHRALFVFLVAAASLGAAEMDRHVVLITIDGFPASMFWDAKTPIPRMRKLAAEGVVAEGMRSSNPTVTWPNHTTLVTGARADRHSVLFNGILVRGQAGMPLSVDPRRDKSELVAVPTVYDILHAAGMRTAGINWPCTRNSKALDDFPDSPEPLLHTTPWLRQDLVAEGILADDSDGAFRALTGPARDLVWTKAACHVILKRKPHLLLFHLLNTDGIHHRYGPQSPASYTAFALADTFIGEILEALQAAGIRDRTTVFLTADHGFATATNILQPNVLLRQAGLLELGASNQISKARAQVIPEGGTGMIYLLNPETREADARRVIELFSDREGVAEILKPSAFSELGLPSPEKNQGMANLLLVPKAGYSVAGGATGESFVIQAGMQSNLGYHGYLASDPRMNATFIAAGRGIKRGLKIGLVENIDVAPTIAHLLGTKLPAAEGKILNQILLVAEAPK